MTKILPDFVQDAIELREYSVEIGREDITMKELIASHRRQRQTIQDYHEQVRWANKLKQKIRDLFEL